MGPCASHTWAQWPVGHLALPTTLLYFCICQITGKYYFSD